MNKLRIFTHPFTWGIIALIALLANLTPWVYPGEAATLMAHLTGVWQAPASLVTAHPLLSLLFGALGKALPVSVAIPLFNTVTAVVGAFCVVLVCQIVRHLTHYLADEPRTLPYTNRAATIAAPIAGIALLIAPDFLRAATHFQWQVFDLFFILGAFLLLLHVAQKPTAFRMTLAAFAWGLIAFESTEILLLTPLFALTLTVVYYAEQEELLLYPIVANLLVPMGFGLILSFAAAILLMMELEPAMGMRGIIITQGYAQLANLKNYLTGPWILMFLIGFMPAFLTVFLMKDAGKNRRTSTLFFTFLAATTLGLLAILPIKVSIPQMAAAWLGAYPLLLVALTALALAGLVAIATLFVSVHRLPEAAEEHPFIRTACKGAGWLALVAIPVTLVVAFITVTLPNQLDDKQFAQLPQTYTDAVLEGVKDSETWLLSDGYADAYLALRIAQRELPVTIFSLTQDKNTKALKTLNERLQQSPYFATQPELRDALTRSLEIGLIPFIQDWLRADPSATQIFATLGLPDLWYTGNRLPLPQGLWYRGATDRTEQHTKMVVPSEKYIGLDHAKPTDKTFSAVKSFATYVKRQESFVLNNTAFYLADAGQLEPAYQLFKQVYAFHPDNISALFNIFELINGGLHPEEKAWCEKEITERIRQLRGRRYQLWALARTYGYIRSPQVISMLAGSWAMSGQTGAALSGLDLALAMLDDGKKVAFDKILAEFYKTDPKRRSEAIKKYQQMLTTSTDRRQSLVYVRELVRMNILENDLQSAKLTLEQVDPTGDSLDLAYERALWLAAAGQEDRARAEIERCLANEPRHQEALAMLATIQLQNGELKALSTETLPKLKTAAGTEDNYFVQIITAQLAERENQLPKARAAYLRALALKPEVHALRNTILRLDIRLNDKVAAARHAKEYLYQDRSLPLANYIMGALALGEGDAKRALSYLSQATAPDVNPPLPEAFNDLAEAHRQLGDWTAALAAVEHACKLSPKLAIARETAAAALLELGRFNEAHAYLKEAFELEKNLRPDQKPDPRLLITRARLYEKEGHPDLARVDLAEVREVYQSLDRKAKAEFEELARKVHLQ